MSSDFIQIAVVIGSIVGPAGAAWAGVKVSLNGTRERVKEIQAEVKEHTGQLAKVDTRLTVIEDRSKRVRAGDID